MDIAGAKALKERLGHKGAQEASAAASSPDVPAEAPPVYHWTGVSKTAPAGSRTDVDDSSATDSTSLFSRLGLGFR